MTTFAERMSVAIPHESAVREKFRDAGWATEPFGQALLSVDCRNVLRRWKDSGGCPSLIRWLPDIFAYTQSSTPTIVLVDAKGEISSTPNHAVEDASITTNIIISRDMRTPTFFVFSDFGVLTPSEVLEKGWQGPQSSNGSGTPYHLVRKADCRPFWAVFPAVAR